MDSRSKNERTGRESQEPQLPRRLLLKAAGTAIVGGGILGTLHALLNHQEEKKQEGREEGYVEQNEAEKFFHAFPHEIPGATLVEKIEIEGAARCLVHILQIHPVPLKFEEWVLKAEEELPAEERETLRSAPEFRRQLHKRLQEIFTRTVENRQQRIAEVQRDIASILTHLHDHYGVRDVFKEGVTPEGLVELESSVVTFREAERLLRTLEGQAENPSESLMRKFHQRKGQLHTSLETALGGATELIIAGKLNLHATETKGNIAAAQADIYEADLDALPDIAHQKETVLKIREATVLDSVKQSGLPVGVLVFGGYHSWQDNIEEWNRQHPHEKFCLIEVTPQAHKKYKGDAKRDVQRREEMLPPAN